jgi:hypothetical protein
VEYPLLVEPYVKSRGFPLLFFLSLGALCHSETGLGGGQMMMMMIHYSCATLLDHDEIIYSPVPTSAVRPGIGQPAGATRRLLLPRLAYDIPACIKE